MKPVIFAGILLTLAACGFNTENDPDYLALKANPPTSIPPADLAKVKAGYVACNVYNEGKANEYQTCWFPSGKPTRTVQLFYHRPAVRGGIYPGKNLVTFLKI